jgi:glycosyltransferase involved in cell wall biosynthesis
VEIFAPTTGISGKMSNSNMNNIIVHAESLKKQLVAKGIDENKIYVVRHFDYRYLTEDNLLEMKSEEGLPNNYILFFGNIAPWKGVEVLIEAAKVVRGHVGKKFNLVIAGEPYEGYEKIPFLRG